MMKKLDMKGQTYFWSVAQEVAKQLQAAEVDGWTYHPSPSEDQKYGRVMVYDEKSCFVGYF